MPTVQAPKYCCIPPCDQKHYDNDDVCVIRIKLSLLSLGVHPFIPFQVVCKIFDILSSNFIYRGLEAARISHIKAVAGNPNLIGTKVSRLKNIAFCLLDLSKRVSILALVPFGILSQMLVSIYGLLINPYHGRVAFAAIDRFFYVPPVDKFEPTKNPFQFKAPCMQPREERIALNIFRQDDVYDRRATNTRFLELKDLCEELKLLHDGENPLSLDLCSLKCKIQMKNFNTSPCQEAQAWKENTINPSLKNASDAIKDSFTQIRLYIDSKLTSTIPNLKHLEDARNAIQKSIKDLESHR